MRRVEVALLDALLAAHLAASWLWLEPSHLSVDERIRQMRPLATSEYEVTRSAPPGSIALQLTDN